MEIRARLAVRQLNFIELVLVVLAQVRVGLVLVVALLVRSPTAARQPVRVQGDPEVRVAVGLLIRGRRPRPHRSPILDSGTRALTTYKLSNLLARLLLHGLIESLRFAKNSLRVTCATLEEDDDAASPSAKGT